MDKDEGVGRQTETIGLGLCLLTLLAGLVLWNIAVAFDPSYIVRQPALCDWRWLGEMSTTTSEFLLLIVPISFFLLPYLGAARLASSLPASRCLPWVWGGAIGLSLLAFLQPRFLSTDAWLYCIFGQMQATLQQNPYVVPMSTFHSPLLEFVTPSPVQDVPLYGPVWMALSGVLARLAGTELAAQALWVRLFALGTHIVNLAMIYGFLVRNCPERRHVGLLLWAWNPLILLELVGDCHNDSTLILFVLMALRAAQAEKWSLTGTALALAVCTKISILPLWGILLLFFWRERQRRACSWMLISLVLVTLAGIALYGPVSLSVFPNFFASTREAMYNSFFLLMAWLGVKVLTPLGLAAPLRVAEVWVKSLRTSLTLLLGLACALLAFKPPAGLRANLGALSAVYLGLYLFVAPYYWPHYLALPILLACLGEGSRIELPLLIYSATSLLLKIYPAWHASNQVEMMEMLAFIHLPPALLTVFCLYRWRRPVEWLSSEKTA